MATTGRDSGPALACKLEEGNIASGLTLVHGLYFEAGGSGRQPVRELRRRREQGFAVRGASLGVSRYSWVEAGTRRRANDFLRRLRGTDTPVDAVEIIEMEPDAFERGIDGPVWEAVAGCTGHGLDAERSFLLIGRQLLLVDGPARGQRVLWFGNGLPRLSETEFIAHYTGHHGPLVASHAAQLGLNRYRQIPSGETRLRRTLLEAGMGRGAAPAVFAELYLGRPVINLGSLRQWPAAMRAIADDEKRHIAFDRSILLLAGRSQEQESDHRRWRQ